ncbi:hypothetical protein CCZ01_03115 [Helicobacter monodelphidis]|uniref:hypothetical protein n=1 Tax=Helicobacter sp. 15-1451 TaxID=2004995 RepID=UPI000DCEDB67|nr:hypothetical protein [Helicobacter sp. 15-1451]RAX58422.1 hypothetical protein CCZ01_03115 [Helicobacter sp. 15-1451]
MKTWNTYLLILCVGGFAWAADKEQIKEEAIKQGADVLIQTTIGGKTLGEVAAEKGEKAKQEVSDRVEQKIQQAADKKLQNVTGGKVSLPEKSLQERIEEKKLKTQQNIESKITTTKENLLKKADEKTGGAASIFTDTLEQNLKQ